MDSSWKEVYSFIGTDFDKPWNPVTSANLWARQANLSCYVTGVEPAPHLTENTGTQYYIEQKFHDV